ncbi:hypothetical protein ACIQNU_39905 [Streptomyces sp. NPDC091292]|uniref:hypothetical protein n=1 Tax=Streptomyces sp. NPDC091292 TaxID=3365991 RepID=UPI0037F3B7AD
MGGLGAFLIVVAGMAVVMGFFAWLAVHVRRRGTAGAGITAALASYDEAFRTTAHQAHYEIQAQADRKSPLLSPDDHWGRGEGGAGRPGSGGRGPGRARPRRARRGIVGRVARLLIAVRLLVVGRAIGR